MRIIALGDTHGRTDWKLVAAQRNFDKFVFIGDYFDSHEDISPERQQENFKEIITFKKDNMDKVVLLFGNHDYHYLRTNNDIYSGYQFSEKRNIQELLHPAIDEGLLQMCFFWQKMLFCHAGVTRSWCLNNFIEEENIEKAINDLFIQNPNAFGFKGGITSDPSGDDIYQSPVWVRPNSLLKDKIEGYIQVVGHTMQDNLVVSDDVIFIDTLGTSGEYLIWDGSQLDIGKIEF